jgi:DNA-binding IscR family transcriptional regulator
LILLLPSHSPLSEFHQLPPVLLRRSLETLVKRGKAQIVKGEAEGVKFF